MKQFSIVALMKITAAIAAAIATWQWRDSNAENKRQLLERSVRLCEPLQHPWFGNQVRGVPLTIDGRDLFIVYAAEPLKLRVVGLNAATTGGTDLRLNRGYHQIGFLLSDSRTAELLVEELFENTWYPLATFRDCKKPQPESVSLPSFGAVSVKFPMTILQYTQSRTVRQEIFRVELHR